MLICLYYQIIRCGYEKDTAVDGPYYVLFLATSGQFMLHFTQFNHSLIDCCLDVDVIR
jgi:hypothetical protein